MRVYGGHGNVSKSILKNKNNMCLKFNLNLKKVVFAWYLELDGDGGAHKKIYRKFRIAKLYVSLIAK